MISLMTNSLVKLVLNNHNSQNHYTQNQVHQNQHLLITYQLVNQLVNHLLKNQLINHPVKQPKKVNQIIIQDFFCLKM